MGDSWRFDPYKDYTNDLEAMYEGVWYVYDLTTGKTVPGVTGTTNTTVTASPLTELTTLSYVY